jgi:hypothetical protein
MWIITLIFIIYFGSKIYINERKKKLLEKIIQKFFVEGFFYPHESYVSANFTGAVSIDRHNNIIGFQNNGHRCAYFTEGNIISSQIIINEQSYQKHLLISTWGRYLLAKYVFNEKIAEISALTSKVKVEKSMTSINLKVTVNSLTTPIFTINFLSGSAAKNKQNAALRDAEHWDGIIRIFIWRQQ